MYLCVLLLLNTDNQHYEVIVPKLHVYTCDQFLQQMSKKNNKMICNVVLCLLSTTHLNMSIINLAEHNNLFIV